MRLKKLLLLICPLLFSLCLGCNSDSSIEMEKAGCYQEKENKGKPSLLMHEEKHLKQRRD